MASQAGQDAFVLSLFDAPGTFLDIGCQLPTEINNTRALELAGWRGVSIDIENWSKEWQVERPGSVFICADALKCDYRAIFEANDLHSPIDYLSLDIEGSGCRFKALQCVLGTGAEFKAITAEHDAYRGYDGSERVPQRSLLKSLGYMLVCADVCGSDGTAYEDWWINPRYVPTEKYAHLICEGLRWNEIIARMQA